MKSYFWFCGDSGSQCSVEMDTALKQDVRSYAGGIYLINPISLSHNSSTMHDML
jgi:hypothetical protein